MSLFKLKNKEIYVTYRINSNKNSFNKDPEPIIQAIYFFLYSPTMTTISAESKTVPTKPIAITVPKIYKTRPLQQIKAESKTAPTPETPHSYTPLPKSLFIKQTPLLNSDISAPHHFTDIGPRLQYSGSWVDYNLLPDFLRDYCLSKAYEMIEDAGR